MFQEVKILGVCFD